MTAENDTYLTAGTNDHGSKLRFKGIYSLWLEFSLNQTVGRQRLTYRVWPVPPWNI